MYSVMIERNGVPVAGRSGLKRHRYGFWCLGVEKLVVYIYRGVIVIAYCYGQNLLQDGDIGLLDGHKRAAVYIESTVICFKLRDHE